MSETEVSSLLVICAHPDDETLGAGGTILKHTSNGTEVDVFCATGSKTRNTELREACDVLGVRNLYQSSRDDFDIDWTITKEVMGAILQTRPAVVITHSKEDYNKNHQACAAIVVDAVEWASHATIFDNAHRVSKVYHMEINTLHPHPHVMVDISETYEGAVSALEKHQSQLPKSDGFYRSLYDKRTRLRGVQAACERAEAFTITLPTHAGPFYPENSVDSLL